MKNKNCEISFYKLTTLPIHKAAPKLIEKIYYSKQRLVVISETESMMKTLDDGLWVYSTKHFIPHATFADEHSNDQPIYLTTRDENPNSAELVMALGKVDLDSFVANKYFYMFDGNDQAHLEFARNKWKSYQGKEHNLTYWQQKMDGSWEKQL